MTRLAKLHRRLRSLRRRRRRVRWGTGYSGLAVAILWLLAGAFLVDWLFTLDRLQRIVAMALSAAVFVWAFRRFTRPWLGHRETELDLALWVERREHIDSDLVAAIQFESPEAPEWGSVELEQRVIDRAGEIGRRLDVAEGFSRRQLGRRSAVLAATFLVLVLGVWQFPDHASAFLNRFFLLGSQHYPTRTVIESVEINGRRVDLAGWRPHVVDSPYGEPVRFKVTCSGDRPTAGLAELETDGGLETTVALSREQGPTVAFSGELSRLTSPVTYQIHLGDDWTEPARIEVVPLPTIDIELEVTPPSYAAKPGAPPEATTGLRQISVIEGSRVEVRIACDKVLRRATLTVDGQPYEMVRDQSPAPSPAAGADHWTLPSRETPLARVVEQVRYEIRAVDADNLEPERPIEGVIRIKADLGPRVAASAVTEFVLPAATPGIAYEASDDYGLARLAIHPRVTHDDGRAEAFDAIVIHELSQGESPLTDVQNRYRLDLAPLGLVKGDRLTLTVEAVDYRGPEHEGKATETEPLVFHVTDERGILAAMSQSDRESAERLKTMIERQIEVGERQ